MKLIIVFVCAILIQTIIICAVLDVHGDILEAAKAQAVTGDACDF